MPAMKQKPLAKPRILRKKIPPKKLHRKKNNPC